MLTKTQRDALAQVIKAIQSILDEDMAHYYTPNKKKYQRASPEKVEETRRLVVADYRNGVSVRNIAAKYNLTAPYVYTIIRTYKKTQDTEP